MSNIAENLAKLQQAKTDIAEAITTKGGTVESGDGFSDFATAIGTIPTSSSPSLEDKVVALDMASGNQTITPASGYDGMERVVVTKPATLIPSNIKSGVTIGGVTGNYTPTAPTLITKSIAQNGTYNASSDNADGYSSVVVNVPTGGGGNFQSSDVNFYDYDGTLIASYTAANFANLAAMPANPSHTGLIAQGWNWGLSDAKSYVANYGKLNIGQIYTTASGKTEYDVEINEATGMTATLGLIGTEKDWGDGTVDDLETHTYSTSGNYTIKLSGTLLPNVQGSKKLQNVRIASGVTVVDPYIFMDCYSLKTITIPNGATELGVYSIRTCRALECVNIPDGVTIIGSETFYGCYNLQKITIPNSVATIGSTAFGYCYSLTSINIPNNVSNIDYYLFNNCPALRLVTVPNGVTSIGGSVFSNCHSLQEIKIPAQVNTINNQTFYNCYALRSVRFLGNVTGFASGAFRACYALQSIEIPSGVTSIGSSAFRECYALQSIELPSNLTAIESDLFRNCATLKSVTIPSGVTTIGSNVFSSCYWLSSITVLATTPPVLSATNAIPSNVTTIYIPNGTLADYQSASNWSNFSALFVELPA